MASIQSKGSQWGTKTVTRNTGAKARARALAAFSQMPGRGRGARNPRVQG